MSTSILVSTKKALGITEEYEVFDSDILMHINTAFSTLTQLGLGPAEGFSIEDADTTWAAVLGDDVRLNNVKSYVYLKVRLLFDPPATSYLLQAMQDQIRELEWRINVQVDTRPLTQSTAEAFLIDEGGPVPLGAKSGDVLIEPDGDMWRVP